MIKFSEMRSRDRQAFDGKTITFKVRRDGEMVDRYGTISRMKEQTFFVGAFCYHVNDVEDVREAN